MPNMDHVTVKFNLVIRQHVVSGSHRRQESVLAASELACIAISTVALAAVRSSRLIVCEGESGIAPNIKGTH
jgi:hypothetical protein